MRKQDTIEELCRQLYKELGRDPAELVQIKPIDGGWANALSYEVTRSDRKQTRIWRRDLDDNNIESIKNCLSQFVLNAASNSQCSGPGVRGARPSR